MDGDDIPSEFYRQLANEADHPMAAFGDNDRFIWVNSAYEIMLGWSREELRQMTWMSVSRQSDVGGQIASIDALKTGRTSMFSIQTSYVDRQGNVIPVEQTVRKFPNGMLKKFNFIYVESPPCRASRPELEAVERNLRAMIDDMKKQIDANTGIRITTENNLMSDKWRDGDKTGGDRIHGDNVGRDKNSDLAVRMIAGVLAAIVLFMTYFAYYIATTLTGNNNPQPPQHQHVSPSGH